jgi:hypothetical protein
VEAGNFGVHLGELVAVGEWAAVDDNAAAAAAA